MSQQDDILQLLGKVSDLVARVPGAEEIYNQIRSGDLTMEEAVPHLFSLLAQAELLGEVAKEGSKLTAMMSPQDMEKVGRPISMETSTGVPQLNPVYEAALMERASVDGDVPEFRSGPLPSGSSPAVPVDTDSSDPILIGLMLKKASQEVRAEMTLALEDHSKETALIPVGQPQLPAPTGVPGYEAGQLPALRSIDASPTEAALLSPTMQRECVYLTVATTQGRRSTAPVIERGVVKELQKRGVDAASGKSDVMIKSFRWVLQVFGSEDISEGCNPITLATAYFAQEVASHGPSKVLVEVVRFDGISNRQFGWTLNLYREKS